jgi:hypothetical protein
MSEVRTQTFFEYPSYSGGPLVVFTAPDDVATVITTMGISVGETLTGALALITLADGLVLWGSGGPVVFTGIPPLITVDVWQGRYVLEPGETLSIGTNDATTADFYAAGFTLTLP